MQPSDCLKCVYSMVLFVPVKTFIWNGPDRSQKGGKGCKGRKMREHTCRRRKNAPSPKVVNASGLNKE
jgi:hypothetical protein